MINSSFSVLPLKKKKTKKPSLKDQGGIELRLVSHSLAWRPAVNAVLSFTTTRCQESDFAFQATELWFGNTSIMSVCVSCVCVGGRIVAIKSERKRLIQRCQRR